MCAAILSPCGQSRLPAAIDMRSPSCSSKNRLEPHSWQKPRRKPALQENHLSEAWLIRVKLTFRHAVAAAAPALLAMAGDYVPQRTDHHIAHAATEAATAMPVVHG